MSDPLSWARFQQTRLLLGLPVNRSRPWQHPRQRDVHRASRPACVFPVTRGPTQRPKTPAPCFLFTIEGTQTLTGQARLSGFEITA